MKLNIEFVVVGGEEGRALRERQAAAVHEALQWFHDNPVAGQTQGSADEPESDI